MWGGLGIPPHILHGFGLIILLSFAFYAVDWVALGAEPIVAHDANA